MSDDDDYYGTIYSDDDEGGVSGGNTDENAPATSKFQGADTSERFGTAAGEGQWFQRELRKAELTLRNAALGLYGLEHVQAGKQALAEAGLAVPDAHKTNAAGSGRGAGRAEEMDDAEARADGIKTKRKRKIKDGSSSLIIVLLALASSGSRVTIELKNDSVVAGTLSCVDTAMNCTLLDATESRQQQRQQRRAGRAEQTGQSKSDEEGGITTEERSSSSISSRAMELQTTREQRPPVRFEAMQVRGDSIRYVMLPRGFNARKEVAAWSDREKQKGMTPKLY